MSTFTVKKRQVCFWLKKGEDHFNFLVIFDFPRELEFFSKLSKPEIQICSTSENIFILKRSLNVKIFPEV